MTAVSVSSLDYIQKQLAARKVQSLDMLPRDVRKQIKQEARRIATTDVCSASATPRTRRATRLNRALAPPAT